MFPAYDPAIGKAHLATLDPEVFDPASGRTVITYQTFVVRTPKHVVLVDLSGTNSQNDEGSGPGVPKSPGADGAEEARQASWQCLPRA